MKKILIVEDDMLLANEISNLLNNNAYTTQILSDFKNAYEIMINSNSDLVLLDINIPYLNGQELLLKFRKNSNIPVIMVTSSNSLKDEIVSMSYGADDYILKPYNPTILLLRINNIFKRMNSNENIYYFHELTLDLLKGSISNGNQEMLLTKNELLIFGYMIKNKDRIIYRDEIMTLLWNNSEYINDNALSVNISRLRNKLKLLTNKDYIETRKGLGYRLL